MLPNDTKGLDWQKEPCEIKVNTLMSVLRRLCIATCTGVLLQEMNASLVPF